MRAFLQQLEKSGSIAESGLKVIAYFDALVEHRATLEACVRAAAALSQCVAGLRDASSPVYVRYDRRGGKVDGPPSPTTSHAVRIGERDVGEVWLERVDGTPVLDELIVERMALAAGVLWRGSPRPSRSTSGLIELVIGASTTPDDRRRATELLGLAADRPLDVAAVACGDTERLPADLAALHQSIRQGHPAERRAVVCSALLGDVGVVLAQPGLTPHAGSNGPALPKMRDGLAAGSARGRPAEDAASAWQQAQMALQFCGLLGLGSVVDYDDLGALTMLAQLPQGEIAANPDVHAIAELQATSRGRAVLDTLEQRLASGSIRETAAALYLHHSSVQYRLRQAEASLGLELEDPLSRFRAELAVILWRLSKSA
jgi:hypothetical protein